VKRPRYLLLTIVSIFLIAPYSAGRAWAQQSPQESAEEILKATGVTGGLIVHVGCGTGRLTAALRHNNGTLVHGLDTSEGNVESARRHVQSLGLYGSVTVDAFDGERLPYTDSLVNLLVVSDKDRLSRSEMLRVLAPRGVAYVRDGDTWQQIVKPRPREIDDWTHYLHGPDNNAVAQDTAVGPPRHMQWLGTPRWSRNHHKLCSISSVVTTQGRIFYIMDEASAANINLPGKWAIVARDAFNGVELWRKPMASWAWHGIRFRSGPPQVTRLLIASGDRVYAPLGLNAPISVMDAATGETQETFTETAGAEEIILADGILLVLRGSPVAEHATKHAVFSDRFRIPNQKTIVAIRTDTGRRLWEWSDRTMHPLPETLACDDGRAYIQLEEGVLCLDLQSGRTIWAVEETMTKPRTAVTFGKHTLVVAGGVVLCNSSKKLLALSAKDGRRLWDCSVGGGFHSPLDIFVIDGLVWRGLHSSDSVAPRPVQDFSEGRDLYTGRVVRTNQVMVDLQTSGHHHRCYREKATTQYILAGKRGIEMMDLEGDNHSRNNWVRGTCQYGILPANGLIYAPPHACGCYMESLLHGFWALAAERTDLRQVPDDQRLEKGPAYGSPIQTDMADEESWPQYNHDPLRSGIAGTVVPARLQRTWLADIGGRLTPPVVAGGKVLLCETGTDTVYVGWIRRRPFTVTACCSGAPTAASTA